MRHIVLTIAAITLLAPAAFAQAPAQPGPQNPAVKSMDENNSSTPVAGANSFTKTQAMKQIEAKGYTLKGQDFSGDIQAIKVNGDTPEAAADPRGRGVTRVIQ